MFMFLLLNLNRYQRPRIKLIDNSDKDIETIPLINFQVDVDVTGTNAQANYTLTYKSLDKKSLVEAKLELPFDFDVIVSDVSLEYKDKILIGQIMKSSNVNYVYNNEKQDKNVVMIVERYFNYISIDLAGIEPNELFTAKISTYTVLDLKFDQKENNFFRRYAFPISMVPYYTPLNSNNEYENYKNTYILPNVNYSFNFNLKTLDGRISSESISSFKSKSNGTIKWNDTSFSYSGEVPNDVIVDIISQSPNTSVEMIIEQFENSTVTEISIPHSYLKNIRKSKIIIEKNHMYF